MASQNYRRIQGTPKEVTTGGFPVQVNSGNALSSPVYDRISENVFVGDAGGICIGSTRINGCGDRVSGAGLRRGNRGRPGRGFDEGHVYVFASERRQQELCGRPMLAAVYQFTTAFAAATQDSEVTVGNSTISGTESQSTVLGALRQCILQLVNATGNLYVCGNTGGNATLYQIPIQAGAMQLPESACRYSARPTDSTGLLAGHRHSKPKHHGRFLGAAFRQRAGQRVANRARRRMRLQFHRCAVEGQSPYAVGQQVLSSRLHVETVTTAGTSNATISWTNSAGNMKTDGTVVWIDQGSLGAATIGSWVAGHHYATATGHSRQQRQCGGIDHPGLRGRVSTHLEHNFWRYDSRMVPWSGETLGPIGTCSARKYRRHQRHHFDNNVGSRHLGWRVSSVLFHSQQSDLRNIRHRRLRGTGIAIGITIDRLEKRR